MPVAVVVTVVVALLLMAALCGTIAIWTILNDLRAPGARPPDLQVPAFADGTPPQPFRTIEASTERFRPSVPFDLRQTRLSMPLVRPPRRIVPPGVPLLPPPLPRSRVLGTRDDYDDHDDEHDYTEVDDGVTVIRDFRVASRR